jgi:hypothetical protein
MKHQHWGDVSKVVGKVDFTSSCLFTLERAWVAWRVTGIFFMGGLTLRVTLLSLDPAIPNLRLLIRPSVDANANANANTNTTMPPDRP